MSLASKQTILVFALFLFATLAVLLGWTATIDLWASSVSWPDFPKAFSFIASRPSSVLFLLLISLLLWQRDRRFEAIFLFLVLFFLTLFLEIIGKTFIPTNPPALFSPFSFMEGTYPSGHMIRVTLFSGLLVYLSGWRLFFLLPLMQALAFLAIEGHTISDLCGGFLLGLSAFLFFLDQRSGKSGWG